MALSTFPSAPSSIQASDGAGRIVSAALPGDGRFSLALDRGHRYMLSVVTEGRVVALVFPRRTGKIDASFALHTNGAVIPLRTVRYLPSAPPTGFKTLSVRVAPAPSGAPAADCVDCVDDDQRTLCGDSEGEATSVESAATIDTAEQADAAKEMAVGEQNAPETVDGCDGESGDPDNLQQQGEH